ncbi:MAG: PIN domain-containing protein [Chloroflexi bacterium]|nr:PIN domain-containing protein [Chloroflexota bacterium]
MDFFLDTNVILRHLLGDDPEKAKRSKELLRSLENGERKAATSDIVIAEVVFVLERTYRLPKAEIREHVLPIVLLTGLVLPGKTRYTLAFDLYVEKNISFADAYNATLMHKLKITRVASYDAHFDRLEGIERFEP